MPSATPWMIKYAANCVLVLSVLVLFSNAAKAKQYNQGSGMGAEQRVKVDKAIAKSRVVGQVDEEPGTLVSEGASSTDCGKLSIGSVDLGDGEQKYGRKPVTIDRDIIITGDVINVATGCNKVVDE